MSQGGRQEAGEDKETLVREREMQSIISLD